MAKGIHSNYARLVLSHNPWQYFRFADIAQSTPGYPNHGAQLDDLSGNGRHGAWWNPAPAQNRLGSSLIGLGGGTGGSGWDGEFMDNPPDQAFWQAVGTAFGNVPYFILPSTAHQPVAPNVNRTYEIWCYREGAVIDSLAMLWGQESIPISGQNGAYLFFGGQFGFTARTVVFGPKGNDTTTGNWVDVLPFATYTLLHVVINFNDVTHVAELFINGVSQGTRTVGAAQALDIGATFRFGMWAAVNKYDNYPWRGSLDEWAVYDPPLTATQIMQHYRVGVLRQRGMFF